MSDLTRFCAARLDEKAAEADDFHDARRCGSLDRDGGFDPGRCDCGHPARLLREVEAGRKILAAWQDYELEHDPGSYAHGLADGVKLAVEYLAAVYGERGAQEP
jgi:Family of unknown function (DUF6221)